MRRLDIAPLPPLIIWEPTFTCNFGCKFCGFYGPGGAKPDIKKEMSSEEQHSMWRSIIQSYKIYKPHVGITGGEPLLKNLEPVLKLFCDQGISWSITTNGSLLNKKNVKLLRKYSCEEVRVSIHGPSKIHNKTVSVKGAFKKVVKNLKEAELYSTNILINCVITDDNVNHLSYMKELASQIPADIRFQHLEFLTPQMKKAHAKFTKKYFGKNHPVNFGTTTLSKKSIQEVEIFVAGNPDTLYEPNIKEPIEWEYDLGWYEPTHHNIKNYYNTFKPLSPYCFQPWGTARIDPYGNVYPCIDYHYGNLKENKFRDIWKGDKAKHFRKILKEKKLFPGCMRCCKL